MCNRCCRDIPTLTRFGVCEVADGHFCTPGCEMGTTFCPPLRWSDYCADCCEETGLSLDCINYPECQGCDEIITDIVIVVNSKYYCLDCRPHPRFCGLCSSELQTDICLKCAQ